MNAFYKGQPIFGPRGPAGPDGNPVGTVISFLGLTAPAGYLVCDGAEYEITAYPDLADHFRQQFGAANHFGGNGTDTFCVPDMRNLFLRGYHGAAEERLSGEVGKRQNGTKFPSTNGAVGSNGYFSVVSNYPKEKGDSGVTCLPENIDFSFVPENFYNASISTNTRPTLISTNNWKDTTFFSARPENMAVLYCVKAI